MAIKLTDTVKPMGDFHIAEAEDIKLADDTRLSGQPIMQVVDELPGDAAEHPNVLYLVAEDGDSP